MNRFFFFPESGSMHKSNAVWWIVCALTLARYHVTDGAQILAMLPYPAKSHWNVVDAVLQTLVARGHNVTVITPFMKNERVANYTEVDVSWLLPSNVGVPWDFIMGLPSDKNNLPFLSSRHRHTCERLFEHEQFWHVIKSNKWVFTIKQIYQLNLDWQNRYFKQTVFVKYNSQ